MKNFRQGLYHTMFHENWYSDNQIDKLKCLVKHIQPLTGNLIEIGCWEGKSTIAIANMCYPETLICNDTWLGNIQESLVTGQTHITETICKERDVYGVFMNNMNTLTQQNYRVVKQDCLEWLADYKEPTKFIHIDASHEFESVAKTIQLILPHMVPGGIICGDDFLTSNMHVASLNGGVERAVRECLPDFRNEENLWYYVHE